MAEELFTRPSALLATARDALRRPQVVEDLGPRYKDVSAPLVLAVGDSDQTVDQRGQAYRLREALPDAELIVLEGTGHLIAETRPEEAARAIDRALTVSR
jgi:pimeloyl-ACP methyl ester carboxylesterase